MSAPPIAEQHGSRDWGPIDAAVHFGFAVLLLTSVIRYVIRHIPAGNVGVLVLAAGVAVL